MEVTYWLDWSYWGQGIASRALVLLLGEVPVRPLRARVASDNVGSLRVLHKAGFQTLGKERSFATARGGEIEETIMELPLRPSPTCPRSSRTVAPVDQALRPLALEPSSRALSPTRGIPHRPRSGMV
jgi:hypothetical protein